MENKKIVSYVIMTMILGIIIWLGIEKYEDDKIRNQETVEPNYNTQNLSVPYQKESTIQEENPVNTIANEDTKQDLKVEIIEQYKGYPVIAKLEIPSIALETYVLKQYSLDALNVSVTKFWGANPNEIGNFCIAGHNFQNKNMFRHLKKVEVGNQLFISNYTIGKVEYEVYDIYKVQPEEVGCLSQETNGKKEVTLITCTSDSKKRIIVKAREVE